MKNTLVVVIDLACCKVFRLDNHTNPTPRLELVDQFNNAEAHGKLGDDLTDLGGRFPRGTGGGAMSDGERHNIELEKRKRLVKALARRLNTLARDAEVERCFLAASREINRQLIEELDPQVRAKILKNIPADLTKLQQTEILKHF
jgi:hypothetical protein